MKLLKLTLLLTILSNSTYAITRYVTPTGSGIQDGSSWTNAAPGNLLQTIINASASSDEVWVTCGTYTTTSMTNRNISFSMRNGVVIYGSFAGTETTLSQRILSCGPCSILSGEIGISGNSDNSYHVVGNPIGLNNTAIIDGFVVQDGNDDRAATLTNGLGGGFYNNGGNSGNVCSPTIRNCVIRNNSAQFGAGILNSGHTSGNSSPIITNCIITNNTAYIDGGGLDNFGLGGVSSPTITNSLIYSNSAAQRGGGMFCWGGNSGNANPIVVNCVFANNSAVDGGGIISSRENLPSGSFSGNSNPIIFNSVFWGNTASGIGPQFFLFGGAGATFNATYSDISLTGQTTPHIITGPGTGNITTNPLFVNIANAIGIDNCWMTSDDGLQLQSSSPLINSGNLSGAPVADILGVVRSGNPDIGAYEYSFSLPMELLSFTAAAKDSHVQLNWVTATETNNDYFNVERSADGIYFTSISKINGVGYSTQILNYSAVDDAPLNGISYYRLKQTDYNGQTDYSNMVVVRFNNMNDFNIYPNPFSDEFIINLPDNLNHTIQIQDINGKLVFSKITSETEILNLSNLSNGIYIIKIDDRQNKKLIKK